MHNFHLEAAVATPSFRDWVGGMRALRKAGILDRKNKTRLAAAERLSKQRITRLSYDVKRLRIGVSESIWKRESLGEKFLDSQEHA